MAPRLTDQQVALIKEMRDDGTPGAVVAEIVGCTARTVYHYAPGRLGKVPVKPLREAFLASGFTAYEIARQVGWWQTKRNHFQPDDSRVKRTLGITPTRSGNGIAQHRTLVDAETVALIAEAIGISPWSVLPDDDEVVAA